MPFATRAHHPVTTNASSVGLERTNHGPPVNGHLGLRADGQMSAGWADITTSDWWTPVLRVDRSGQRNHPLAGYRLGQPVGITLGGDQVSVMQQAIDRSA